MTAIDSEHGTGRAAPDLSFLERVQPRSSDIPNLGPAGRETGGESRPHHGEGKVLTIGRGITVSGEISACDTLIVEGTVDASLTAGRTLDVARGGAYSGQADVDNATIAGRFDGELTVRGRLQITAEGQVRGTVRYGRLEIETGGELNGDIAASAAGR
jgi:cytoskeletal protein CcmA (bactofilin family)